MENSIKNTVGRPKLDIAKDELLLMYSQLQSWNKVAQKLGVSKSTITKRVHDFNLKLTKQY